MKQSTGMVYAKQTVLMVFLALCQVMVWAQDTTSSAISTTTTTTTTEQNWYAQPWVWIVGGAVLLLLIVALVRGNNSNDTSKTDRVTVTKSVRTDTDV